MMLDHIGLEVSNYEKSKAFYTKTLAPLGYELIMEWEGYTGFGTNQKPEFWIHGGEKPTCSIHIAFKSKNRKSVDAFYDAALNAGAKDNGKPGIREMYHPDYYGAFVLDPDGNNVEAVCHDKI